MEQTRSSRVERWLEGVLFASRWMLAPLYLGLAATLAILVVSFAMKAWALVTGLPEASSDEVIVGLLSLIDLSLMANLVLIVVWAGYENFVSRLDTPGHPDRPDWISHIGYGDLKLKLMTSIVAISAIHVLEDFMHISSTTDRQLMWSVGIHLTFVASGLLLALMDRLTEKHRS